MTDQTCKGCEIPKPKNTQRSRETHQRRLRRLHAEYGAGKLDPYDLCDECWLQAPLSPDERRALLRCEDGGIDL